MKVKLIDHTIDPLGNINFAARTSYRSHDKEDYYKRVGFVKSLIKLDHTPVEFAYTFWHISGISRACANQLNRYRLSSQCQESMRYVNVTENGFVYPPKALAVDDSCVDFVIYCKKFYEKLVKNGVPIEDARYFLPIGMETTLNLMCNFRELRHILKQRLDSHAQWEVRKVAKEMYDICFDKWPWLVEDLNA